MPMTTDPYYNSGDRRSYPVSPGYRPVPQEQPRSAGEDFTLPTKDAVPPNGATEARYGLASGAGRWPLLADDVFRVAHEDRDGGRLLHPAVAGLGLAAARHRRQEDLEAVAAGATCSPPPLI